MTLQPTPAPADLLVSAAATLRRVRLLCVPFAAVQFAAYRPTRGVVPPHEVRSWGIAVVLWLIGTTALSAWWHRREHDEPELRRGATVEVVLDVALVLGIVHLLSFDLVGAQWGLVAIVALEAAMRLERSTALVVVLAACAAFAGIQSWSIVRHDLGAQWTVVTFRTGMILTIAGIGWSLAQRLRRQVDAARLASAHADERAELLRIAADAGRAMTSLGSDRVLDAIVDAALQLGFDAADVCVLDDAAGVWRVDRRGGDLPEAYVSHGHAADVGLSSKVRREGHTVIVDDYLGWEGALPEVREGGFTTVICTPVRVRGEIIATLGVGTRRPRPVSAAELECLELLAAQASAALDATSRQSEAVGLHELLLHSSTHDRLTGLPNRDQLVSRIESAMASDQDIAALVCDLDAFKTVNDSLGHLAGDQLLRAVAARLRQTAGDRVVARLAGDEFAVLVHRGGIEAANRLARMILLDLREPLDVDGSPVTVSMSIGVAARDQSVPNAAALLHDAALAMERAKQGGRGRTEVFDPSLRLRARERLGIETDLRAAVADGSIAVAYQPIVSLETGAIVGVEALARWTHPTRGPITPAEFIPLAEETGLIDALGHRVLEVACRQARTWLPLSPGLQLSVNLSAVQLTSERCAESVLAVLQATGFPPAQLTLELTESAVMDDVPEVLRAVQSLAGLGVRLAIDDLGRGWSSLAYLTRYPLSELKIDRTFVQGVARRPADRAVVRALVGLAHDLGLVVVGEGIEDADQLGELSRLGVDHGQGFFLHRPQGGAELTELVAGGASLRVG